MTRRPLTAYLVAALLASALAAGLADTRFGDVVYFAAFLPVCVAACWAARRRPSGHRRPWAWVAGSQLFLLVGDAVYPVTALFGWPDDGVPQAVLWTGGYLAYGLALVGMARLRAGRRLRGALLDTLTFVTAATLVTWVGFISPHLREAADDPLNAYLVVMGPIGDVVILAGVLLIALAPGVRRGATRLLLVSAVLRIVSDLGTGFLSAERLSVAVNVGTILLSNALLVGAALHSGADELTTPARRETTVHPARPWFLGAALLTAPTILFLRDDFAAGERIGLFTAAVVTAIFVLLRFTSALRSLERVERQLSFQARRDPLTGLLNRTALATHLETVAPVGSTLLYLDLDGFKAVNDQAGHEAGDAILCAVAGRLRAAVRDHDAVARLGGDEFVVVLQALAGDEAAAVAERILRDVALPVEYHGVPYSVGVSIGMAGGGDAEPASLLRDADAAMYRAKRAGRGRCELAA